MQLQSFSKAMVLSKGVRASAHLPTDAGIDTSAVIEICTDPKKLRKRFKQKLKRTLKRF